MANYTSADKLFPKSMEIIKNNLNLFAVLYTIPAIYTIWDVVKSYSHGWTSLFNSVAIGPTGGDAPSAATGSVYIILLILDFVVGLALTIAYLRTAEGNKPSFGDIWDEFKKKGLKLFLLMVSMFLLILGGLILVIIPGIILIWRLYLAPYILLDKDTSIGQALQQSWDKTRGKAWPIYSIILFGIVLALSGIIPFIGPILAFILTSLYAVAPALRYLEIKKAS